MASVPCAAWRLSANLRSVQSRRQKQNQNVVISMTAVRRAARAIKRINSEQVSMWESFWRASRFPEDQTGHRPVKSA
jgi:hypothetical protein